MVTLAQLPQSIKIMTNEQLADNGTLKNESTASDTKSVLQEQIAQEEEKAAKTDIQITDKNKLIVAVYNKVKKFCDNLDGVKQDIVVKDQNKQRTRSNTVVKEQVPTFHDRLPGSVTLTYGRFTLQAMVKLAKSMMNPKELDSRLPESYSLTSDGSFLDIGSGYGFPNFVVTAAASCRGLGIEIDVKRWRESDYMLERFTKDPQFSHINWGGLITFINSNAGIPDGPFFMKDGSHCTHIFAYNILQINNPNYMEPVISRLNQTNFKILAWSANETQSKRFGLKNVVYLCKMQFSTWGKQKHTTFFYAKDFQIDEDEESSSIEIIEESQPLQQVSPSEVISIELQPVVQSNFMTPQTPDQLILPILRKRKHAEIRSVEEEKTPLYKTSMPIPKPILKIRTEEQITLQSEEEFKQYLVQQYKQACNSIYEKEKRDLAAKKVVGADAIWHHAILNHLQIEVFAKVNSGGQATIFLGQRVEDHKDVVVKVMKKEYQSQVATEQRIFLKLNSNPDSAFAFFIGEHIEIRSADAYNYVILKYYTMNLRDWLLYAQVPLITKRLQLNMICRGISYLHLKDIAHCDIKLSNIMIDGTLVPRIIDFGMAHIKGFSQNFQVGGTKLYMAPELQPAIHEPTNDEMKLADCWSLGVLMHLVLYGQYPFGNQIINREVTELPPILFGRRKACDSSPTVEDPIMLQAQDLISRFLQLNPRDRMTAQRAAQHPFLNIQYEWLSRPNVLELSAKLAMLEKQKCSIGFPQQSRKILSLKEGEAQGLSLY